MATVSYDRYIHENSLHVTAFRYYPSTHITIKRFTLHPVAVQRLLPPNGVYIIYRDEFYTYVLTPEAISGGEEVTSLPLSPVRDVVTQAVVTSIPQPIFYQGEQNEELRTVEYYRTRQEFTGVAPPPLDPPPIVNPTTVSLPPSVTGGYSDTTVAFVVLLVALLLIIFLSSRQQNWVAYHD